MTTPTDAPMTASTTIPDNLLSFGRATLALLCTEGT